MSQYLPEDIIDRVREAADIVAIVSEHVPLKKAGSNHKGLCPFHLEKTPSFSVNPQHQIFKCFGCGKGGNVFHFLMAVEGMTFPETVISLAERHGISIPQREYEKSQVVSRKTIEEALAWGVAFFQRQLASAEGACAREYLKSRHISENTIEKFQLGYAPDSWDALSREAQRDGIPVDTLTQAGLVSPRKNQKGHYDRFRNRLMFPIWNHQGKAIAFGGRVLSAQDEPKYLNSSENAIFAKKRTLYAFHMARPHISRAKELVIMEGYTDVLMAHQHGFYNVVGTLGTSLTPDHASVIRRYAESVVLVFDGDAAGVKAASRSLNQFLSYGLMVKIAVLPDNLDPGELIPRQGPEEFAQLLSQAEEFFDFQMRQITAKYDMSTTSARRNAIREISKTVAQIPDKITRSLFTKKISETFQISQELLSREVQHKKSSAPRNTLQTYRERLYREEENFILYASMHYPEWGKALLLCHGTDYFRDPQLRELAKHIAHAINQGMSLDIARISSQMEPELGKKLIEIYMESSLHDIDSDGKLESRLMLIMKGIERKRYKAKLEKFKSLLQDAHEQDQEFKKKILEDAHEVYKDRLRTMENLQDLRSS